MSRLVLSATFLLGCIIALAWTGMAGWYSYLGVGAGIIGIAQTAEQILMRVSLDSIKESNTLKNFVNDTDSVSASEA